MDISALIKNHKFLILALILALLNMGAIFTFFGLQKYSDSLEYFDAIRWFQGQDIEVSPWRFLRPLGPLLSLPFEFLGEGAGLIVQNAVFYLFSAFLIFKIIELVYGSQKQAFLGVLFFVTATSVLDAGLAYLTDAGAWFFYLFSIFLTLLYFKNKNKWLIPLNGFLSGMAFLMKENGALGIFFFGLMIIFAKDFNDREKISKLVYFLGFFLIPILLLQVLSYRYFQVTSLDWYLLHGKGYAEGFFLTLLRYFGQLFRTLGLLWIFFFIGIFLEWREKNRDRIRIYLALLPSSLSFFLWPTSGGGRVVFIFAPLGILLASYGCKKIRPIFLALIVIAVLFLNYTFVYFNKSVPFTDIIYGWIK